MFRSRSAWASRFTTTLTVCFYVAILLTLPVLLYEIYAFVIPALSATERKVATPVVIAAPLLFVIGVVFTFIIVLPAAMNFLQGYNADQFDDLVQAKPLYSFEVVTMGAIGLAFQLPLVLLGLPAARRHQWQHSDPPLALRYGHHRRHRGGDAGGGSGHDRP